MKKKELERLNQRYRDTIERLTKELEQLRKETDTDKASPR